MVGWLSLIIFISHVINFLELSYSISFNFWIFHFVLLIINKLPEDSEFDFSIAFSLYWIINFQFLPFNIGLLIYWILLYNYEHLHFSTKFFIHIFCILAQHLDNLWNELVLPEYSKRFFRILIGIFDFHNFYNDQDNLWN